MGQGARHGRHGGRSGAVSASSASRSSFTPRTFAEVTDVTDVMIMRRKLRRSLVMMRAFAALLLVAAIAVAGYPLALQYRSAVELQRTSDDIAARVADWSPDKVRDELASARAYNKRLAASGQPVLGEAVDPFSSQAGGSHAKGEDTTSAKDKDYQSQLDTGGGVMGTIRIPKVSIDLPIYHGTSQEALASGAGHLYGTSLPVGGKSTHSVITGHRGLVEALMFTRLDEMQQGDFFYIEVMGETLAYQVDRISVIKPDDTRLLRVVDGEDRVTLMTCTPYGVNTHRLLVSGHRVAIPVPAPYPNDVLDGRTIGLAVGGGLLAVGWGALAVVRRRRMRRRPMMAMRHAAGGAIDGDGGGGGAAAGDVAVGDTGKRTVA
ncbi:class C sortase [Bifidobacterium amazonense]|uniref:Class C sortase n=1 Tax=Bifidobacterium amazonense TaxID=2809027 RepID=A0ABS9VXX9_9BIFI|nr:class C sortase [Bifidobacterium amazonense]MCH9276978.1 class C sortase [Bifidobacterium amazonense]